MGDGSFEVHQMPDGRSTLSSRAVRAAVLHALGRDVAPPPTVDVGDSGVRVAAVAPNAEAAAAVEDLIASRLGMGFWIDLGIADTRLDIDISVDPTLRPPLGRRVE